MARQPIIFNKLIENGLFQTTWKLIHDQLERTKITVTM